MARKYRQYLAGVDYIRGQEVTAVIGVTGSGKSTLCAAMSCPKSIIEDEDDGGFMKRPDAKVEFNGEPMFTISSNATSGTKMPGFMPFFGSDGEEHGYLVDTPGSSDTRAADEFPNQACIFSLLRNAQMFRVIILIKYSDIIDQRGANFLQVVTSCVRFFKASSHLNDDFIIPLVTNANALDAKKQLMNDIDIILEVLQNKYDIYTIAVRENRSFTDEERAVLAHYSGPLYPNDQELVQVIRLLEFFKTSVRVIEPMDSFLDGKSDEDKLNLQDLELKLEDCRDLITQKEGVLPLGEAGVLNEDLIPSLLVILLDKIQKMNNDEFLNADQDMHQQFKLNIEFLLSNFEGKNEKHVQQQLHMLLVRATTSKVLRWYSQHVVTQISASLSKNQVQDLRAESSAIYHGVFKEWYCQFEMTNEEDLANADWYHFIYFMKQIEQHSEALVSIRDSRGESQVPDLDYDGHWIDLTSAIDYLMKHLKELESESSQDAVNLREQWVALFRENFITWLQSGWPDAYLARSNQVQIGQILFPEKSLYGRVKSSLAGALSYLNPWR